MFLEPEGYWSFPHSATLCTECIPARTNKWWMCRVCTRAPDHPTFRCNTRVIVATSGSIRGKSWAHYWQPPQKLSIFKQTFNTFERERRLTLYLRKWSQWWLCWHHPQSLETTLFRVVGIQINMLSLLQKWNGSAFLTLLKKRKCVKTLHVLFVKQFASLYSHLSLSAVVLHVFVTWPFDYM